MCENDKRKRMFMNEIIGIYVKKCSFCSAFSS